MERISTIQTASVITQPVDAVEPLTLIEKLKQEKFKEAVKAPPINIEMLTKENRNDNKT